MTERTINDIEDRLTLYMSAKAEQDQDERRFVSPVIEAQMTVRSRIMASLRHELKEDAEACVKYLREPCGVGGAHHCQICTNWLKALHDIVKVL